MEHGSRARRTHKTEAKNVPIRRDRGRKEVLVSLGVGISMVVIGGLYAASFRSLDVFSGGRDAEPRWAVIPEDVYESVRPVAEEMEGMKKTVAAIIKAKMTQADSIERLKSRIESASSAPQAHN